ncbi:hypothetical protein MSG28_001459 [Choristoneura fumiferana]|uniref:Uncharacterized protein n=1 Tax=Choristoneura fumiferana TaxID=7141 RepID=A0ACC0KUQ4_CHOFU|nr:hypothetical protein MSG28_001459 [Choristoneura fumiferana]
MLCVRYFRNKSILDQAIEDIDFFGDFPEFGDKRHTVWLFLMELTRRRWGARPRGEMERAAKILREAGSPYCDVEATVWEQRKYFKDVFVQGKWQPSSRNYMRWATLTVRLVNSALENIDLTVSVQGASTLCRALRANSLRGVVAQTHASSPRCSAYLAAQLHELAAVLKAKAPAAPAIPQLGKLIVFGAGDKVSTYVNALRELGIEASEAPHSGAPVCVLSEAVHCDTPTVTSALDGVVAVLATPPNSYSAVLTESEIDVDGKARVQSILEEQKKTLKTLLSKPQIQLILYETHSALEAENQAQIQATHGQYTEETCGPFGDGF